MKPSLASVLFVFILMGFSLNEAKAQIAVTNTANPSSAYDPISLIETVFLSGGANIDTVIYTGNPNAVGYFQNGNNSIGINEGIILTSGNAESAIGPNLLTGTTTIWGTTGGSPELASIATAGIRDLCEYEIRFTPTANTLTFQYVFASEEYPEFVGSTFNDVFGFFISQAGGAGPFTNIALIPGTTTPVSINNVNGGSNASFYIAGNTTNIEYDGFTTVLTATANVIPCQLYTIKLAISDVGDGQLDSGVFLAANSFNVGGIVTTPATPTPDTTLVEGCDDGTMTFSLPVPPDGPYTVNYTVGGTATMGVDYQNIPLSGVIPAGQTSFSFPIITIPDNIVEGTEYIEFIVFSNPCVTDTIRVYIQDNNLTLGQVDDAFICPGDQIQYDATSPIPLPPSFSYSNTTPLAVPFNQQQSSILNISGFPFQFVTPNMIESVCIDVTHPWDGDLDIFLIAPDGKFLELTTDNGGLGDNYTATCFTQTAATSIVFGTAPFTGDFTPEGSWSFLNGAPVNGDWKLQLTDDGFGFDGTLNSWSINFAPIYDIQYSWSPSTNLSCVNCPDPVATPTATTTYVVSATDSYGCTVTDTSDVTFGNQLPASTISCGAASTGAVTFNWTPVLGATSYLVNVNGAGWITPTGTLSHTVTGLTPGQSVSIEVQAQGGNCPLPAAIAAFTCTAANCSLTSAIDSTFNVSCFGGNDGRAYISAPTGVAPYTYDINGTPQNTGDFTGLAAGTYNITVTDAANCFVVQPITITEPTEIQSSFTTTNVSCNGGSDGAITVTSSGGTGTHTYAWSNSETTASINGLTIGTYTVTVTDGNGCTHINDTTITEPTAISLSVNATDALCNGGNTGQVFVTAAGGTPNYTYAWSHDNTLTSDTANNLSIGTYTVTVTDDNGCSTSISGTVGEPSAVTASTTSTDASCSGATDGTATVTPGGGVGGYTYAWSSTPVQTTATATNLSNGSYTVTVTDANGCTTTATATINVPSPILMTYTTVPASCLGATDGSATAMASGGAGGFSYVWNTTPAQNTATATGLGVGNHIVTVTDMDGCSDTFHIQVPQGSIVVTPSLTMTAVNCNGGTDGTAMVSAAGGTGPYNFVWDGGQNSNNITNLSAGTYYVTATDNIGCFGVDSIEVTEPLALTSTMTETNLSCYNNGTGAASIAVQGGTPTYNFNWDSGQMTATINNLQAGTYIVTVTDANNCTLLDTAILTEPDTLDLTMSSTQVSCNGAGDGTTTVVPTGGTMPYSYAWNTTPIQTTATATGLSGGLYTVTVTDFLGCSSIDTISVLERTDIVLTESNTPANCYGINNGTATVNAIGGAGNYSYAWNTTPVQTMATATNLLAGTYTVTVTDNDGCTDTISTTISEPDSITITITKTDISCFGANDGTASASAIGGVGGYTYAWNTTPVQTTASISGLGAGTYIVTVTDANNCTNTASITIIEPLAITFTTSVNNLLCKDDLSGFATITPSGGAGGFTYVWSTNPVQTTATATGLDDGTYSFTITDVNNCFTTGSVTLTEPDSLLTSMTGKDITCNSGSDGSATISPTGGTFPYTYTWNTNPVQTTTTATGLAAGLYLCTVTDANGCVASDSIILSEPTAVVTSTSKTDVTCFNGTDGTVNVAAGGGTAATGTYTYAWSPSGANTSMVTNVGAGWHFVTVTDDVGCVKIDSVEVLQPDEIILTMSATPVVCSGDNNGTTTVSAIGGTGAYSYIWNTMPSQTTATATGLTPGWYVVTVTDINGCTKVDSAEVTAPNALGIAVTGTNIDCYGNATGTADVAITGGVPNYTTNWSNGQNTTSITGLIAGTYVVTVSDMNGCSLVDSITLTEPTAPLQLTLTDFEVNCNGGNDGSITSNVTGGTGPYNYSWNTRPNAQITANATNLTAGVYTLIVTDANGCFIIDSIEVEEPAPITLLMTEEGSSCNGGNDGTATVAASGGVPGYTYNWSTIPSQSTTTATNLIGGQTYTVIVTDTRNCVETQSITISQPDPITLTTIQDDISCNGLTDGTATVQAAGGTPAYFYQWDNNANNQPTAQATGLGVGTYTVTVTDTLGCFTTTQVTITEPAPLFSNTSTVDVACFGEFTGSASAQVAGGTSPYNIRWDSNTGNIINNTSVSNLASGTYFLTFTDANGCELADSVTINQPSSALNSTVNGLDVSCYNDRDGEIDITADGGTAPFEYSLDGTNYSNANRIVGVTAGDYTVYTRDANGCVTSEMIAITQPEEFTVTAPPDLEIEMGTPASLGVLFGGGGVAPYSILWTPSNAVNCPTCQFPLADSLTETTYFEVFVTDANGCEAEDDVIVRIDRPRRVFVANAFTPNGDGNNDVLFVQGGNGTQRVRSFQVYDRWGELVFDAQDSPMNDPSTGWDATFNGKTVNPGIFAYIIEVEFIDGEVIQYKGSTQVIR